MGSVGIKGPAYDEGDVLSAELAGKRKAKPVPATANWSRGLHPAFQFVFCLLPLARIVIGVAKQVGAPSAKVRSVGEWLAIHDVGIAVLPHHLAVVLVGYFAHVISFGPCLTQQKFAADAPQSAAVL